MGATDRWRAGWGSGELYTRTQLALSRTAVRCVRSGVDATCAGFVRESVSHACTRNKTCWILRKKYHGKARALYLCLRLKPPFAVRIPRVPTSRDAATSAGAPPGRHAASMATMLTHPGAPARQSFMLEDMLASLPAPLARSLDAARCRGRGTRCNRQRPRAAATSRSSSSSSSPRCQGQSQGQ